jgi:hypothetical protein
MDVSLENSDIVNYAFYHLSDYLSSYLHTLNIGITPNGITIFRFVSALLGIYCIYNNKFILGASLILLDRFLDCMDGLYARKYKMFSDIGDKLEHACDNISQFILAIIIYLKLKDKRYFLIYVLFILIMVISCSCENIIRNKKGILENINHLLCPNTDIYHYFFKYIGEGGSNILVFIFISFYLKKL